MQEQVARRHGASGKGGKRPALTVPVTDARGSKRPAIDDDIVADPDALAGNGYDSLE